MFAWAFAIFQYRQTTEDLRPVIYLIWFGVLTEVVLYFLAERGVNNLLFFNLFITLQYFLVYAYYFPSHGEYGITSHRMLMHATFIGLAVSDFFILSRTESVNFIPLGYQYALFTLFGYRTLRIMVSRQSREELFWNPHTWVNLGFFIYFSSNLILLLVARLSPVLSVGGVSLWSLHAIPNLVLNIMLAMGLYRLQGCSGFIVFLLLVMVVFWLLYLAESCCWLCVIYEHFLLLLLLNLCNNLNHFYT